MTSSPVSAPTPSSADFGRWAAAIAFAICILIFLTAQFVATLSTFDAIALNDISWWLAGLAATLTAARTAVCAPPTERRAWWTFAAAFATWLVGQSVWTYYELVRGALPAFPHWMQLVFTAYTAVFVTALVLLPKPVSASPFSARHGGNLALIVCAVASVLILALLEPALQPNRSWGLIALMLLHCAGLTAMFATTLYLIWSYAWTALHWPLLLLLAGAGTHLATYIVYAHQLLTQTYQANAWFNVSWLVVFGAYTCAAYERLWGIRSQHTTPESVIVRRQRWLEALIPALLIVVMLLCAWFYRDWVSARVAFSVTVAGIVFATILGFREMWIQRQEQRLLDALNETNAAALTTNRELVQSETRYRTLSTELERRVNDRTLELQQAYRELENFSYAVAHDLKSPLRSIDGFGALLAQEFSDQLGERGQSYLQRMRRSALNMAQLIDDLLAYARVDRRELRIEHVDICPLIDSIIAQQRDELERHRVQIAFKPEPLKARADPDGLELALRNLLQNAIKFSQHAAQPTIDIELSRSRIGVLIAVRDNGVGFDMAHHDKIFDLFQRLHRADEFPGTGIGLAIVRKAVERMGGRVWGESKPGAGATFYVRLPAGD